MTRQEKAQAWEKVPLGTLAEFRNGVNFTKTSFGRGIKVINVKDFQDRLKPLYEELGEINPAGIVRKDDLLKEDDILFVRSNGNRQLIGRSLLIKGANEPITHSAFTIRARFQSPEALPLFYAYALRSHIVRDALSAFGGGTNINNLNQGILSNLLVPLPPLAMQGKIAQILSAYDELIDNNTRRIKILEEMAQSLYREWFVNFRFPGHENVKLDESNIPHCWEVKRLADVSEIVMGQSPRSEFYNESGEGLPFHQGVTNLGDRFPVDRIYCTVENRIAEEGDVLCSVRAPVGRLNIADKKIVIGRGLCAIRSKTGNQRFIFQQLSEKFLEEDTMGGGTIFKSVTKDDMHGIEMVWPDEALLARFDKFAKLIFEELENLTLKSSNLRRTRDLLLPGLVSGCATNLWVVSASSPLAFPKTPPNDHLVGRSAAR